MHKAPGLDNVLEPDFPDMRTEVDVSPSLSLEMSPEDRQNLDFIKSMLEQRVNSEFAQAFSIENRLLAKVRTRLPDDSDWVRNPDGSPLENWEDLSTKELESFIQEATSWAFYSSQRVIDSYAEAVFAKFTYDDAYDIAYGNQLTGTVGDKTAKAKRRTQSERWMALYQSLYYKKAKEIVDRLDTHVRRVERIYMERQKQAEREFRASRV